jgi:histidinol-phosphatase (PHP family)
MRMDAIEQNEKIEKNYNFDYVLGSIHFVNNVDIFDPKMYENKDKKIVYENYFKDMIACLKHHKYIDTLAHIDYICRYAQYEDKEIYYDDYRQYIDEVLKNIINNDICLEINTRRLNSKGTVYNLIPIYKRYSELGGKYVTFGSDAHNTDSIGMNFKAAEGMSELCSLRAVYFKNRKLEYI